LWIFPKEESDKHICIVKIQVPEDFKKILKEFDLNLIWTTPLIITQDKRVYSCIGENESIKTFLELIKNYGEVINISFQTAAYQEHDILSVLTEKQREIIIAANKYGYYDYPKKINSQQLSQKVKLSKSTLIQHLRKAEGRIMANISAGY
jgi:predicted DNA binding protein